MPSYGSTVTVMSESQVGGPWEGLCVAAAKSALLARLMPLCFHCALTVLDFLLLV